MRNIQLLGFGEEKHAGLGGVATEGKVKQPLPLGTPIHSVPRPFVALIEKEEKDVFRKGGGIYLSIFS